MGSLALAEDCLVAGGINSHANVVSRCLQGVKIDPCAQDMPIMGGPKLEKRVRVLPMCDTAHTSPQRQSINGPKNTTTLLIIIVVLVLMSGGGGFCYSRRGR